MLPEVIVGVVEQSDPQDDVQTFRSPAHACKCLNSVNGFDTIFRDTAFHRDRLKVPSRVSNCHGGTCLSASVSPSFTPPTHPTSPAPTPFHIHHLLSPYKTQ